MKEFVIFTDSCCDLPADLIKKEGIEVIPMSFGFNDQEIYLDDSEHKEMSPEVFYNRLRNKEVAKTNQISIDTYLNKAKAVLNEGKDILVLSFSSALSGTFNVFELATQDLLDEYKDAQIKVVDSLCASLGQGLFVYLVNEIKKSGANLEECYEKAIDLRKHIIHVFTVDDIGTLKRGGRLSASKAFLANLLNLKPVLHVDDEGRLVPIGKKIGRRASLIDVINHYESEHSDEDVVFISHGDALSDAEFIKAKILAKHPNIKVFLINTIGPVIGAHSGPGTIALFYKGEKR